MEGTPQLPGTDLVLVRPVGTQTRDWPPAVKCGANRSDGERCRRWAVRGGDRCPTHGAQLPSVRASYDRRVMEARLRLTTLADPALDVVERALANADDTVALKAAQQVLDRIVPRLGVGVNVSVGLPEPERTVSAVDLIRARMTELRAASQRQDTELETWTAEPVEGEVVDTW